MYEERKYRKWVKHDDLLAFEVVDEETDLLISCKSEYYELSFLSHESMASVSLYRRQIKDYIAKNRKFLTTFEPMEVEDNAPEIVKDMAKAASIAGVGPMAAVAGAISEFVGRDLLRLSDEIIVENGGDIFIKASSDRLMGIYASESPFTGRLGIRISPEQTPTGICTSSGTVGHSISFGKADAALVISKWTALADAVATATGNIAKTQDDIQKAVDFARSINGVDGVIVIMGSKIGIWGSIELVRA